MLLCSQLFLLSYSFPLSLGFCYQHGVGVKGVDLSQAFYLYECAALQGHQDAEDVLNKDFSKLFEKVILVYSDIYYDEELESLGLLTNKKNRSHRNKSDSFDFDIVIERCSSDDDSSEELKISESITIDFQLNSGQSESNPHKKYDNKIVSSVSKAFEELVKHAEKGHKLAMAFLIVLYYYGINGQYKDTNKAHNIARSLLDYLKLYSDEKNNCYTQCILGFCYDKGVGIAANPYEAFRLYELSAKLGDYSVAQCILGNKMLRMHVMDDGNTDDCEDSGERSMKWYKMAAENDNPIGQFEMGKYFENYYLNYCSIKSRRRSSCQMKNTSAAIDWYIKAADNGHIEAQRRLESLKCF